jgi:hypothetical protein
MSYELNLIDEEIIYLRFSGESDSSEHEQSRDEAAKICREKGLARVLVDMSAQTAFMASETMDLYKFGESFVKGSFPRQACIAVVADPTVPVGRDVNFVITVARNRGFRVQLFQDQEEALQWLRG